ncbi:hypothetical protein GOV12_03320 [Candidatus Pacearchaeota archaeon]|nr:hypothetical protein [Candidatus Pacearchaeota archaeon]
MEKRGKSKIVSVILISIIVISVISLFVSFVNAKNFVDLKNEENGFLNALTNLISFNWVFQIYSPVVDPQNAYYGVCNVDSDCAQPVPSLIRSCGNNNILETLNSNICVDGICVEKNPFVYEVEDCSILDNGCNKGVCDEETKACVLEDISICKFNDGCCPSGCDYNGDGDMEDSDCGLKCDDSPEGKYCGTDEETGNSITFCLGDIDKDGRVWLSDWSLYMAEGVDFNRDGIIDNSDSDDSDLNILRNQFNTCFGGESCLVDLSVCDDGNSCTKDNCDPYYKVCINSKKTGCTQECLENTDCPKPDKPVKKYFCKGNILNIGDEKQTCDLKENKCVSQITYKKIDCSLEGNTCVILDNVGHCKSDDEVILPFNAFCGDGICQEDEICLCNNDCGECVVLDEKEIIEEEIPEPEPSIIEEISDIIINFISFALLIPIGDGDSEISSNDISSISLNDLIENAENSVEIKMNSDSGDGMITKLRFIFSTTGENCIIEKDINDDPLYPFDERSYIVDISGCENDIISVEKIEAIEWMGLVAEADAIVPIDNEHCYGADFTGPDGVPDGKVWLAEWGVVRAYFGNIEKCYPQNNWCDGADFLGGEFGGPDGKVWLAEWGAIRANFGNIEKCYGPIYEVVSDNSFNINDEIIQISTCSDLQRINEEPNGNFELINDIDCEETMHWDLKKGFNPIGTLAEPFTGSFNGKNYYIDYLYINRPGKDEVGLFGVIEDASLENIGFLDSDIVGRVNVGILAGLTKGNPSIGMIKNSYSSGIVKGLSNVGGLVGFNNDNNIMNCYSQANVIGIDDNIGGLVGKSHSNIINSYSIGDVEGESNVGGLVGYQYNQETETDNNIENSFSTSDVICEDNCGAIMGLGGNNGIVSIIDTYFYNNIFECSGSEINGDMGCIQIDELEYFYDFYNFPMSTWDFSPWADTLDGYYFPSLCSANSMSLEYCADNIDNDCDGEVDESDCIYEIFDCYNLQDINLDLNGNYKIMYNMDCSDTMFWNEGKGFIPIGSSSDPFTGNLNGNGYEIYDLFINRPDESLVGLFGVLGVEGGIYDVNLINVVITGKTNIGSLVGSNKGTISNAFSSGIINGEHVEGGLVGGNEGLIKNSATRMDVISTAYEVGGLVGVNMESGTISNSFSKSKINADAYRIGGFVGRNLGMILNSYSNSEVIGGSVVGGFIGYNQANGKVENCFSSSVITSESNSVGGFIGQNDGPGVINNFYNKLPDGPLTCGSLCTIINNEENYFFDLSNEPMVSWEYPPWSRSSNTYNFPVFPGLDDKECVDGDVKACESGFLGMCSDGYSECSNGVWRSCISNNLATGEICLDEIDNDCDGEIDEESCYLTIETCEELQDIGESIDQTIVLLNDIDCSESYRWNDGSGFDPISLKNSYFNGKDFEISGLYINRPLEDNIGLFSSIEDSEISYLGMVEAEITGNKNVGILVGELKGEIYKVYVGGTIYSNSDYLGGMVGNFKGGLIENSFSVIGIFDNSNSNFIGGLVGGSSSNSVEIINSFSAGSITSAAGKYIGGFVGGTQSDLIIKNVFSDVKFISTEQEDIGGLVGGGEGNIFIQNSYWNNRELSPDKCYPEGDNGCTKINDNSLFFVGSDNNLFTKDWDFYTDWKRTVSYPLIRKISEIEPDPYSCYRDIDCPSPIVNKRCGGDENVWKSEMSYTCVEKRCVESYNDEVFEDCISDQMVCEDVRSFAHCENCEKQIFYSDKDNDGFGDIENTKFKCYIPSNYVTNYNDCYDNNHNINPDAEEICGDDIDNDCDGEVDENCGELLTSSPTNFNGEVITGKAVDVDNSDDEVGLSSIFSGLSDFFGVLFNTAAGVAEDVSEAAYGEDDGEGGYYGYCGQCKECEVFSGKDGNGNDCNVLYKLEMEAKTSNSPGAVSSGKFPSGIHILRDYADDGVTEEKYYEIVTVTNPREYSIKYQIDLWTNFEEGSGYTGDSITFEMDIDVMMDRLGLDDDDDISFLPMSGELEAEFYGEVEYERSKLVFDPPPESQDKHVELTLNEYLVDEKRPYEITVMKNGVADSEKKIPKIEDEESETYEFEFRTIENRPDRLGDDSIARVTIYNLGCEDMVSKIYGGSRIGSQGIPEDPTYVGSDIILKTDEYIKIKCKIELPDIGKLDKEEPEQISKRLINVKFNDEGNVLNFDYTADIKLRRYWTYRTGFTPEGDEIKFDGAIPRNKIILDKAIKSIISFLPYNVGEPSCLSKSGGSCDDEKGCSLDDQCVNGNCGGFDLKCPECQVCIEIPPALHFEVMEADSNDIEDEFDLDYIEGIRSDEYKGQIKLYNDKATSMKYEIVPYPEDSDNPIITPYEGKPVVILGPKGSQSDKGSIIYMINLDKDTPKEDIINGLEDIYIKMTAIDEDGIYFDGNELEEIVLDDEVIIVEMLTIKEIVTYDEEGNPLKRFDRFGTLLYKYDKDKRPIKDFYNNENIDKYFLCGSNFGADGNVCTLKNPPVNKRLIGFNKEDLAGNKYEFDSTREWREELLDILYPENSCSGENGECCFPRDNAGLCYKGYCNEESCPPSPPGETDDLGLEKNICGKCGNCDGSPGSAKCGVDEETEGESCCNGDDDDDSTYECSSGGDCPTGDCPTGDCPTGNCEEESPCSCGSASICSFNENNEYGSCGISQDVEIEEKIAAVFEAFHDELSPTMAEIIDLELETDKQGWGGFSEQYGTVGVLGSMENLRSLLIYNKKDNVPPYNEMTDEDYQTSLIRITMDIAKIYEEAAFEVISSKYSNSNQEGYITINPNVRTMSGGDVYFLIRLITKIDSNGVERVIKFRTSKNDYGSQVYAEGPIENLDNEFSYNKNIFDNNNFDMIPKAYENAIQKLKQVKKDLENSNYVVDQGGSFYNKYYGLGGPEWSFRMEDPYARWHTVKDDNREFINDDEGYKKAIKELDELKNQVRDGGKYENKLLFEMISFIIAKINLKTGDKKEALDEYNEIIDSGPSTNSVESDAYWAKANLDMLYSQGGSEDCKTYLVQALKDATMGEKLSSPNPNDVALARLFSKNLKYNILEKIKNGIDEESNSIVEVLDKTFWNPGLAMWCPIADADDILEDAEKDRNEMTLIINAVILPYQILVSQSNTDLQDFYRMDDEEQVEKLKEVGVMDYWAEKFPCHKNLAYCSVPDLPLLIANGEMNSNADLTATMIMENADCDDEEMGELKDHFLVCIPGSYEYSTVLDETWYGHIGNEFNALNGIILLTTFGVGFVARGGLSSISAGYQTLKNVGIWGSMKILLTRGSGKFLAKEVIGEVVAPNVVKSTLGQTFVKILVKGPIRILVHIVRFSSILTKELAIGISKFYVIYESISFVGHDLLGYDEGYVRAISHIASIPLATLKIGGVEAPVLSRVTKPAKASGFVFDKKGSFEGIYQVLEPDEYNHAIGAIEAMLRNQGKWSNRAAAESLLRKGIDFELDPAIYPKLSQLLKNRGPQKKLYLSKQGGKKIVLKDRILIADKSAEKFYKTGGPTMANRARGATGPGCFLADTKIMMADGSYKNIQDIRKGEMVKAYDLENEVPVDSEVTKTFIRDETEYRIIEYEIIE